jgi:antitoxin PrlF
MKISERGQVTIPRAIREKLGLGPDTEITFHVEGDRLEIRKARAAQRQAVESLFGRKSFGRSTDDLLALLRE